jgi:hypothetical protein
MNKILSGILALGLGNAMANEICGKVEAVAIREDSGSARVKFYNNDKLYLTYDSGIASTLVVAKAGKLTVCIDGMINDRSRFLTVVIKD